MDKEFISFISKFAHSGSQRLNGCRESRKHLMNGKEALDQGSAGRTGPHIMWQNTEAIFRCSYKKSRDSASLIVAVALIVKYQEVPGV